jgi:hypothetical protein
MRDAMGIGGERKRREKDTPTFGQTRSPNDTYFARRVVDPGYDAGCPEDRFCWAHMVGIVRVAQCKAFSD